MDYKTVICGGTFDRLHEGHKYFLRTIFSLGKRVLIGLTSDTYTRQYKKNVLPFQKRLEDLKTFLAEEGLLIRAEIFSIQDVYGKAIDPTLSLDAIMVTDSTKSGGEAINKKRRELGLAELPLVSISLFKNHNHLVLSSTKIREGVIGRHGEIYMDDRWKKHTLILPVELRGILHKPFHTLLTGPIPNELVTHPQTIVTVGDATTKRLNHEGLKQVLSVVDFSVERKSLFHSVTELEFSGEEEVLTVANPSGHITPQVWEVLQKAILLSQQKRVIVQVDGEEDLLVIPLILLLPLGWNLFYGQPKEGVVYVPITEEVKERVYQYLIQFVRE